MNVLGIDAALRVTGLGVVCRGQGRLSCVMLDTLKNARTASHSACLNAIDAGIAKVLEEHGVDAVAIEGGFYCKNVRTAMTLGEVRGVAIAACTRYGIPVFEYAPRRVKQAVVGYGNADKEQVSKMVMQILALPELPQADAGDALALAVCHLQNMSAHAALAPKPL